jgi:hypothetical protein
MMLGNDPGKIIMGANVVSPLYNKKNEYFLQKTGFNEPVIVDDEWSWLNLLGVPKKWAHIWINPFGSVLDVAVIENNTGLFQGLIKDIVRIIRYKSGDNPIGSQYYFYHFIATGHAPGQYYFLTIIGSLDTIWQKNMLHFRFLPDTETLKCSPGYTAFYDISYCYTCGSKK